MPIPDFQSLMLPLLKLLANGKEWTKADAMSALAREFRLSDQDLKDLLPSGKEGTFQNRVSWARSYLKMAELIEYPRRSFFRIAERGREVLARAPERIDIKFLNQFPEFVANRQPGSGIRPQFRKPDASVDEERHAEAMPSPEESIQIAFASIERNLANELIDQIKKCSPSFFERLVVDLLVKMGYGGTLADAGEAIGRSGDGGIDGTIKEDKLGLDVIYLQAKRWENVVGRPQIQSFVGALHGKGNKGVFITTSSFSKEALDYARSLGNLKLILIDGEKLAELMIDHNAGVATKQVYEIKKIDYDYFSEEE